MSGPSSRSEPERERLRDRFLGIDESFSVKSYYPQLKTRLRELEIERSRALESEARLAKLNAELEVLVDARTAALQDAMAGLRESNAKLERTLSDLREAQARVVLSEKMAVVGRLVAGIAHEVNSPLGALLSSVTLIDAELPALIERLPGFIGSLEEGDFERYLALVAAGSRRARGIDPSGDRKGRAGLEAAFASCPNPAAAAQDAEELGAMDAVLASIAEIGCPRTAKLVEFAARTCALLGGAAIAAESTRRTARIIAALGRYSREGKPNEPRRIALREEFVEILAAFRDKARGELQIDLDIPADLAVVGEREALAQVWLGLVSNAIQAMDYRGRLGLSARRDGASIVVSVTDSGHGIPGELRDRVFEPFFTTKRLGEGTGLGLNLARKVVEAHGGGIAFESEPGRTVFNVRLPAATEG